jgi:hypothetical protein
MKASNPYSKTEDPVSWAGWKAGFASKPGKLAKKDIYGPTLQSIYEKAFYRGQGAQTVSTATGGIAPNPACNEKAWDF